MSLLFNGSWLVNSSWQLLLQTLAQFIPSSLTQLLVLSFWSVSVPTWCITGGWNSSSLGLHLLSTHTSHGCWSWCSEPAQTSLPGEPLTRPPPPQVEMAAFLCGPTAQHSIKPCYGSCTLLYSFISCFAFFFSLPPNCEFFDYRRCIFFNSSVNSAFPIQ